MAANITLRRHFEGYNALDLRLYDAAVVRQRTVPLGLHRDREASVVVRRLPFLDSADALVLDVLAREDPATV